MTRAELRRALWLHRAKVAGLCTATWTPSVLLMGGQERLAALGMWEAKVGAVLMYALAVPFGFTGLWLAILLYVSFKTPREFILRAEDRGESDMTNVALLLRREGALGPIRWPF